MAKEQIENLSGILGFIERAGNRLPHPVTIFLILTLVVMVLSFLLQGTPMVDPKGKRLHHEYVCELVHNNSRQEIRLTEDHTAACCIVHYFFPVFPCILHAHTDKFLINFRVPVSRHHTDCKL